VTPVTDTPAPPPRPTREQINAAYVRMNAHLAAKAKSRDDARTKIEAERKAEAEPRES
jgi:hypothetical protein